MTRRRSVFRGATPLLVWGLVATGALAAAAQDAGTERPEMLRALLACRDVPDGSARLACFDSAAEAFDVAERDGRLVVVDRARVIAARREMFGIDLPSLPDLFGRIGDNEPLAAIETTLVSASGSEGAPWNFVLADGSRWQSVGSVSARISRRPDQAVRVRRAAMGSYLMTIGNSQAIRVRRLAPG